LKAFTYTDTQIEKGWNFFIIISHFFAFVYKKPRAEFFRARGILYYMMRFLQCVLRFMLANA